MAQELMNPAGFKRGPAAAFRGMAMDESLSDGIGGGYPLIRYGGKVWSIDVRGSNYRFVDEKGYPTPYLDVIILRQAQNKSKAYFPNWEEGSRDAPVCASLDGIVPDAGVEDKQSDTCALCPRNKVKTNEKGLKVKECSDAKRLAVLPLPAQTEKLLGQKLVEPVFLRVPAGSLQNLAQMGDNAKKQGYAYFAFVTRIDFDPEKSYPKMQFTAIQELGDAEAGTILELREDPQSYRIVTGDRAAGGMKQIKQAQAPVQLKPPTDLRLGNAEVADRAAGGMKQIKQAQAPVQLKPPTDLRLGNAEVADRAIIVAKLEADRLARLAAVKAESAAREVAAAPVAPEVKARLARLAAESVAHEAAAAPVTIELKANPPAQVNTGTVAVADAPIDDTGEPEQADEALDAAIAALLPKE